jgi:hypothetical protein
LKTLLEEIMVHRLALVLSLALFGFAASAEAAEQSSLR